MKVAVKLDEGEIKATVLDWLENNSEAVNQGQWENAQVELSRDASTGKFVATATTDETFDATEVK